MFLFQLIISGMSIAAQSFGQTMEIVAGLSSEGSGNDSDEQAAGSGTVLLRGETVKVFFVVYFLLIAS
jgi:hypothetical protein